MELKMILQHIQEATGILIQLFEGNDISYFGNHPFEPNPANQIIPSALASDCTLGLSISPDNIFIGFVRIRDTSDYLIIGPMLISECTKKQAQSLLFHLQQSDRKVEPLLEWLRSIPIINKQRLYGILYLINLTINGQSDHSVITIPYPNEAFYNYTISSNLEFIEPVNMDLEKAILSNIEYGNVEELEKTIRFFAPIQFYNDAKAKKSYRDIIVASVMLSSRAAVKGGLDYTIATAMGTKYLETMEFLNNTTDITLLIKKIFLDFANKVAQSNKLTSKSLLVKQISREITTHINEKITPSIIANNLNMSCSYLCNHFKKETGKTITDYTNELKIHESKYLLKNTHLSLIEISTRLGFSSQSYFHIVFKKHMGMTPHEFRNTSVL
ncbi:MAG: helix-turn-helix transcriptional regulator [Lachnotalea sp.]